MLTPNCLKKTSDCHNREIIQEGNIKIEKDIILLL